MAGSSCSPPKRLSFIPHNSIHCCDCLFPHLIANKTSLINVSYLRSQQHLWGKLIAGILSVICSCGLCPSSPVCQPCDQSDKKTWWLELRSTPWDNVDAQGWGNNILPKQLIRHSALKIIQEVQPSTQIVKKSIHQMPRTPATQWLLEVGGGAKEAAFILHQWVCKGRLLPDSQ